MKYFALVPAAGVGARCSADTPKQYLPVAGRPLLWHTLSALLATPAISMAAVVLAPDDAFWMRGDWSGLDNQRLLVLRCGGATRAASVNNGLRALNGVVADDDWVLVHDAARCCLSPLLVDKLISAVGDDAVGGLLAQPLADTLKRSDDDGRVAATPSREGLWRAQTPQMFRHRMLLDALTRSPQVTDEAAAMEAQGHRPLLVASDAANFKVTFASDLHLAELLLATGRQ